MSTPSTNYFEHYGNRIRYAVTKSTRSLSQLSRLLGKETKEVTQQKDLELHTFLTSTSPMKPDEWAEQPEEIYDLRILYNFDLKNYWIQIYIFLFD